MHWVSLSEHYEPGGSGDPLLEARLAAQIRLGVAICISYGGKLERTGRCRSMPVTPSYNTKQSQGMLSHQVSSFAGEGK
jgi:hypothetical protein